MIDYGQCKELGLESRLRIARFIVALAEQRPQVEIAKTLRDCGMRTENDEDEFMADFASLLFGKLSGEMMERSWHQRLHKLDKIVEFPGDMISEHTRNLHHH